MATKYTKQQFLQICMGTTKPKWSDFLYNILFTWDVNDTADTEVPGHTKVETDARARTRSVTHTDGHTRCVLAYQMPLLELIVNTVQTEIGTTSGVAVQGRGFKVTPYERTLGTGEKRLNFICENSMALSNADGSITTTETPANSGNYVINCPTAWAHKMKLTAGGAADYLGNKLMNSLYVAADTIGVQHTDSASIGFTTGGGGMTGSVLLDGTTLEITASGLRLNNAATYCLTAGGFSVAGLWEFTQLPRSAAVPAINTDLTNKLYVDTAVATKVGLTGNETVAGIKTFSSFPVTPSAAPTLDYQVANKKYVDDEIVEATAALGWIDSGWIQLTNAQALQSFTVPKTYIAAPGAGKYIYVYAVHAYNDYGSVAFNAAAADTYDIEYTGGTNIMSFSHAFLEAAADTVNRGISGGTIDINASIRGLTTTANLTLGDGCFYFRFIYQIITLP